MAFVHFPYQLAAKSAFTPATPQDIPFKKITNPKSRSKIKIKSIFKFPTPQHPTKYVEFNSLT